MADFTESRIQTQMRENSYEIGISVDESYAHELAELQLKDLLRKGCTLEGPDCRGCSCMGGSCPLNDWEKRHPEYANDELATRIKILEAGGEESYKTKLKLQEEAKREAEKATDTDRIKAVRYILDIYFKSKKIRSESDVLCMVNEVIYAKTKNEIQSKIENF